MNIKEIKQAIDKGIKVFWVNDTHEVIRNKYDQYLIKYKSNNSCIGLTCPDGKTLNGDECDFYTE